eukprot:14093567-Alexandrium_andersonii.AAC.1
MCIRDRQRRRLRQVGRQSEGPTCPATTVQCCTERLRHCPQLLRAAPGCFGHFRAPEDIRSCPELLGAVAG